MAAQFSDSVEMGLKLSKRIYYGPNKSPAPTVPPKPVVAEQKSAVVESYLPTAVMLYAEITEPAVVDNPEIPSYQPYVHGRCEPPALIPLHMHGVSMEVECYLDTAFVTVSSAWRVHCVAASKSCDCRVAVPMGEQGSVLGVEVESPLRSYAIHVSSLEETGGADRLASAKDGFLIKGHIYTVRIPQVDGGSTLSVKISWSQKLLYRDGQFCINIPFTFPPYVIPRGKKVSKKEKILLNVNSGTGSEVLCKRASHPLQEIRRQAGQVGFSYEREVQSWSMNDFSFSYTVPSSDIFGGLLLQSPSLNDCDQRDMFCFYLYPGSTISRKVFRKEVVFLVDISGSMQGSPLENVKTALLAAIKKLNSVDTFNVIAFNGDFKSFSSMMELATQEAIERASQWIVMNLIAEGGTNISTPLSQAIKLLSKTGDVLPVIFLITDGAVEDEKEIYNSMKGLLMKGGLRSPRIYTFGIGSYCNHYFLQSIAQISRGYYVPALDVDMISLWMARLIDNGFSIILADISVDTFQDLDSFELYPSHIPDLSSESPLFLSGRYQGNFPESVTISGTLADLNNFTVKAKVQKVKDVQVDRVFASRQIDALTSRAWLMGSKLLERKVAEMSLHTGVCSEYTNIILVVTEKRKFSSKSNTEPEKSNDLKGPKKAIFLRGTGVGFGNLAATAENLPPEAAEPKLYETSDKIFKAATSLCSQLLECCCCMCFIQFCNRLNDRCAVTLTQLCTGLACFECLNVCSEVCEFDFCC